jgi:hypothetical protein
LAIRFSLRDPLTLQHEKNQALGSSWSFKRQAEMAHSSIMRCDHVRNDGSAYAAGMPVATMVNLATVCMSAASVFKHYTVVMFQ